MHHAPALLGTPGISPALLLDPQRNAEPRLLLFAALVEQAGVDRANGGRLAAGFLAEAQETIEGLAGTGDELGIFETESEAAACIAFARLRRDQVEILSNIPLLALAPA